MAGKRKTVEPMKCWTCRIMAISVNPDMADRDDIARLAADLMDARHALDCIVRDYEREGRLNQACFALYAYDKSRDTLERLDRE